MGVYEQRKRTLVILSALLLFGAFGFLQIAALPGTAEETGELTVTLDAPDTYILGDDQNERPVLVDTYLHNPTGIGYHTLNIEVTFDAEIFTFGEYIGYNTSPMGDMFPTTVGYSPSNPPAIPENGVILTYSNIAASPSTTVMAEDIKIGTIVLYVKDGVTPGETTIADFMPTLPHNARNGLISKDFTFNSTIPKTIRLLDASAVTTHIVDYSVTGGNGTLGAAADGSTVSSGAAVDKGSNVVFTAAPDTGYRVKEWKLNGTAAAGNTANVYSVNSISADTTVTVEYEPIPAVTHTVTYSVTGSGGSLNAAAGSAAVSSGTAVEEGINVVFTAAPDSGYRVKEWTLNGSPVSGTNTYTVSGISADTEVTAEFERIPSHTIAFSVVNGNGSIDASDGGTAVSNGSSAEEGSSIAFTASPGAGYRVKEWTLNGSVIEGNKTNTYVSGISADTEVTVEFEIIPSTKYELTYGVSGGNGSLAAAVSGGTAVSSGAEVPEGSGIVFTASPSTGYRVKEWMRDGSPVPGNAATYTVIGLSADTEVTVEFEQTPSYTVIFSSGSGGSISAADNGNAIASPATVPEGSSIAFTASPSTGYRVKGWTYNGSPAAGNKTNTYVSGISADTEVTVEFEIIPSAAYIVTYGVTGSNGSLIAAVGGASRTSPATVAEGSGIVFMASPDSGYRVKEWMLNGLSAAGSVSNSYVISGLSENMEVTVEFEAIPSDSTFTVVFYDDEDMTVIHRTSAPYGTLISALTPEPPKRLGYSFVRWAGGLSPWMTVTGNHSFYAVYVPDGTPRYTVLFYDENGKDPIEAFDVPEGTNIATLFPNTPQKEGRTFVGWEGYEPDMAVTESVVFAAIYVYDSADRHTLTFLAHDGSVLNIVRNVPAGTPAAMQLAAIPHRSGYTFTGWEGFTANMKVTSDLSFTAMYKPGGAAFEYIVTFDTAAGSDTPVQQYVAENGTISKPADPVRDQYDFKGWYNGEEEWDFENDTVTGDMTLTAKWEVREDMQDRLPWIVAGLAILLLIGILLYLIKTKRE